MPLAKPNKPVTEMTNEEIDAWLRARNADLVARGKMEPAAAEISSQQIAESNNDTGALSVVGAFFSGLGDAIMAPFNSFSTEPEPTEPMPIAKPTKPVTEMTNAEIDAWLRARNADLVARGKLDPTEAAISNQQIVDSNNDTGTLAIVGSFFSGLGDAVMHPIDSFANGLAWEGEVVGGTVETVAKGAAEAVGNVVSGAGAGATAIVKKTAWAIPWWIYAGAAAAAFLYFGGLGVIKRSMAK